ncbi:MAG TPA: mandelate racemase/muconate lactonizing enzyme family protein [Vicinamibacterales bacterium]|nr:mandelate racemase/muconate lactonizing enzyme family protein [Vicinamibacterales bacterium]
MTSQVVDARLRLARVPVDPPRGDAIQQFDALELPIVEVSDASGHHGVGFGYTIGTGGSAIATLLRDTLLPQLIGCDGRAIVGVMERLRKSIHALTPGCISSTALAAIDVALWDLAGHRTQTPLYILLGGARSSIRLYNTHVGWLNRPLDEMVDLANRAVERDGFTALKIKIGKPDVEEDIERLSKVREAVGRETTLMVDANQSWTIDEAIRRMKMLEPFDLYWIEEPLEATDLDGYARLGAHIGIARAGGESLYSPAYFHEAIRRHALDILQPDVARVGGITGAMQVCHLAQAANLKVAPHVSPELSVAVACAVPNSVFVEYIPQMEPILAHPVVMRDGCAIPPDVPGHGIEFNPEALEHFTVCQSESSSSQAPQPA